MKYSKTTPYFFILPMATGLLVFRLGPIIVAALASFTKWNIRTAPQFIGIGNYTEAINSEIFWLVVKNTIEYMVIFVPGVMLLALLLALLVNQKLRGIAFFRGIYFLPYITAMVAVAMVWNWIFATRFGILNFALTHYFHISNPPAWLADQRWALPALTIVAIWKESGFQMMVFLAGLQGIPTSLYEAAAIDGADKKQQFFKITFPLLSPVTFFVFINTLVIAFKTFDITYTMTGGGPNYASTTLVFYIYQNAFIYDRMGYATANAVLLLLIVGAITMFSFKMKERWVNYAL